jgi:inner membrane transporter RhtA
MVLTKGRPYSPEPQRLGAASAKIGGKGDAMARAPQVTGDARVQSVKRGTTLVVLAALAVEVGAAFAKRLFDEAGPAGTVFIRVGFAAVILMLITRASLRGHTRPELVLVAAFGLALGGMNLAFYSALDRLPLGVTVAIEFLGPLGVAVAGSRRPRDVFWVALATAGVLLLSPLSGNDLDGLGMVLAATAGVCWAAYIVLSVRVGQVFPGVDGLAIAMTVGAIALAVPGIVAAGDALLDPKVLGMGLAVAVLSSVVPYSLELEALRHIPARTFGVLMSLEMVMAALAGWIVLSEALGVRELTAIAMVLVANVGAVRSARTPS